MAFAAAAAVASNDNKEIFASLERSLKLQMAAADEPTDPATTEENVWPPPRRSKS